MNLIACSELCKHQKDGYCALENSAVVSSLVNECCFFEENSTQK